MNLIYDYVFITHLPAFYKVNLYNEIAKSCKVFVIFVSQGSLIRTPDFTQGHFSFDYSILNNKPFEQRNLFCSISALLSTIKKLRYRKLVVGGWDLIEFWMLILLSPKSKNALALESSVYESKIHGLRGKLKQIFLSRIATAFSSGEPQISLLKKLGFTGISKKTYGVGIFHYPLQEKNHKPNYSGKFLFVGRLAKEKNLKLLIEVFAQLPHLTLTIIGEGKEKSSLQSLASRNVKILGHVPNSLLPQYYQQHDIFVLPSLQEPWGLVVEEALFYGLPVIASNRVGCAIDLIQTYEVGALFDPTLIETLHSAIEWTIDHYEMLIQRITQINFQARDSFQIQQYHEALK